MLAQPPNAKEVTCAFKHSLIEIYNISDLHEDEFYAQNTYSCNICQESHCSELAPSNHCMTCKFDLCPSCYEEQKSIQISCPKDHALFKVCPEKFYGQYLQLKYYCDFCDATIEKTTSSAASCRICEYDLCPGCLILAQSESEPEIPEIEKVIPQDFKKDLPKEKNFQHKEVQVSEVDLGIQENNDQMDKLQCVMCLGAQRSHFFTPCMHLCGCGKCSTDLIHKRSNCPICNCPIQSAVKIYLA